MAPAEAALSPSMWVLATPSHVGWDPAAPWAQRPFRCFVSQKEGGDQTKHSG